MKWVCSTHNRHGLVKARLQVLDDAVNSLLVFGEYLEDLLLLVALRMFDEYALVWVFLRDGLEIGLVPSNEQWDGFLLFFCEFELA